MNYPTIRQVEIISIQANPAWMGMFRKAKKFVPVLFIIFGAVMALSAVSRITEKTTEALPIVNYSYNLHAELATPEASEPVKPRPEAKSKLPKVSEFEKNPNFPVGVKEIVKYNPLDYIERFSKIAVAEMKEFGIPASISIAQGLIESRAGTSKMAVNSNNHFGMKCFSRNCKKGHCSNYSDDTHKDFFKNYSNAWQSYRAHSQLLSSGRYQKLHKYGNNYRQWAYGLKSVGYATDRTYAEKLIGIIERYDLHKYDR